MIKTRIKKLRIENNYTQREISEILNVNRRTYGGWENNRLIPITYLIKLAEYYNVSVDYLLYNTNNMRPFKKKRDFNELILCQNITKLRESKRFTKEETAKLLHVERTTISKWENNHIEIKIDNIKNLANLFDISIDKLIGIID